MKRKLIIPTLLALISFACNATGTSIPTQIESATNTAVPATAILTEPASVTPTSAITETPLASETPSPLPSNTPLPIVESLKATVNADLLSCRYGPGAEYLYLYALRKTARIELIGRTDANNWVWVAGQNKCWVNANFLEIQGNPLSLPIVYPGTAKLPVSPYYPGPKWAKATREGDKVQVYWEAVPISPGKYESERMHQYILEVWRCEGGKIQFETLGTNFPYITVDRDQAGCSTPSHGRVFVQEKHGFGGPVEVPWPAHP